MSEENTHSSSSSTRPASPPSLLPPIAQECSSDRLDDANLMPLDAKQRTAPGQRLPLSRQRVVSSIPRGSLPSSPSPASGSPTAAAAATPPLACPMHQENATSETSPTSRSSSASSASVSALPPRACPMHEQSSASPATEEEGEKRWEYPSQQMFYNAMRRKGYEPDEKDMGMVVAIHNAVNERTWSHIATVERHLHPECEQLKLVHFRGRPLDSSPKARLRSLIGYKAPFDRHDWLVDRCGEHVRYVIDFYQGQPEPNKPIATHIDARPAVDSLGAAWDRIRLLFSSPSHHRIPLSMSAPTEHQQQPQAQVPSDPEKK